jgi:hypothetical protein
MLLILPYTLNVSSNTKFISAWFHSLNCNNVLTRSGLGTSPIIGTIIEHIKNVDEWASKFSIEKDLETNFPKELPKPDLINRLLQFEEWDHTEYKTFIIIYQLVIFRASSRR